jgi:hypothetical protein
VKKKIPPENVMRGILLFCLVAMGIAAILRVKNPSSVEPHGAQLSETGAYFFFATVLFGIFYGEYVWVPRILKRPLNVTLGFAQTFLCLALLLLGLLPVWQPDLGLSGLFATDSMGVTIAILGEALFALNVCWTLMQPAPPAVLVAAVKPKPGELPPLQAQLAAIPALQTAQKSKFDFARWKNPQNPFEMFAVSAVFLFLGGIGLQLLMGDSRFLVPWGGRNIFLPMGFLWWIGAIPFAGFAAAYWFHAGGRSAAYDKVLTKAHLFFTFVWLIDFVRIMTHAQWALMSFLPDLMKDSYTFEIYALLGAAIAMFFVNINRTRRAPSK